MVAACEKTVWPTRSGSEGIGTGKRASPVSLERVVGSRTSRETRREQPCPRLSGRGIPIQEVLLIPSASSAGVVTNPLLSRSVIVVPICGQLSAVRLGGVKQRMPLLQPAPKLEIAPAGQGEIVRDRKQGPPTIGLKAMS